MFVGSLPPASNKARYVLTLQVIDEDTSEGIDLTDYSVTFSIRDKQDLTQKLSATEDDGISMLEAATGFIELTFTSTQMRTLEPKVYDVGCTILSGDVDEDTDQYIIGTLSVLDGVVT